MMTLNSNEEMILSSDNKQLILTSQRIIQSDNDGIKSIDLKDYVGFEVIKKKSNYYLILAVLLGILDIYLFLKGLDNQNELRKVTDSVFLFFLIMPLVPLFFWYRDRKKYVKIIGKYNSIEFLAQRMPQASIDKLIKSIHVAKDKISV